MARHLILRLEGPLMSFGGVAIDESRPTDAHPGRSMITGLLANALGWRHQDADRLQSLQDRMCLASRRDHEATRMVDFQTVDLGQDHLMGTGWTTWHAPETRKGGSAKTGTHIRERGYLADALFHAAVGLVGPGEPDIETLAAALRAPQRPLFLGRKSCPPASPLLVAVVEADSPFEALKTIPWRAPGRRGARWRPEAVEAVPIWHEMETFDAHTQVVHDRRNWANQVHTGRSFVRTTMVPVAEFQESEVHHG